VDGVPHVLAGLAALICLYYVFLFTMLKWRCLILSLMFGGCLSVGAQEPVGLLAWTKEHPDWKTDKKELAYVASQCATMYDLIGNFFAANPIHEEQRRSANIFLSNSDIYARIGYFLSIRQGMSEQEAVARQTAFQEQFSRQLQENLLAFKNIMVPPLSDDVEVCMVNFKFAQVQVRQIEAEYAKVHANPLPAVVPGDKSFDMVTLEAIWRFIKTKTSAPPDMAMPPLVIQPGLPTTARMVFEFPSEDQPQNTLQINVSPRTLQLWSRPMVNWALGHELVHYAMLMRENQWVAQLVYKNTIKHHCNPEFLKLTGDIADFISDAQSPSRERLRMYSEVFRSCTRHPDQ